MKKDQPDSGPGPHEDDTARLLQLANRTMPFGKYAGRALMDLPEPYLLWFQHQGFPKGELGQMLALLLEIKTNGLEYLLTPLRAASPKAIQPHED